MQRSLDFTENWLTTLNMIWVQVMVFDNKYHFSDVRPKCCFYPILEHWFVLSALRCTTYEMLWAKSSKHTFFTCWNFSGHPLRYNQSFHSSPLHKLKPFLLFLFRFFPFDTSYHFFCAKFLSATIFWNPFVYVRWYWKGQSKIRIKLWPLSVQWYLRGSGWNQDCK